MAHYDSLDYRPVWMLVFLFCWKKCGNLGRILLILTRRDDKQLSRAGQALDWGATFCCGEHSHQSDFPALDKNSDWVWAAAREWAGGGASGAAHYERNMFTHTTTPTSTAQPVGQLCLLPCFLPPILQIYLYKIEGREAEDSSAWFKASRIIDAATVVNKPFVLVFQGSHCN